MNENEGKAPGETEGRARHGYRNEVSWDAGRSGQPYANQGSEEAPAAAHETEAGNRGQASGRNMEQLEAVKGLPGSVEIEAPART